MADARNFALGIEDRGTTWFLSRAANLGNLMRTSDPFSAWTWPTVAELEAWVDALPEGSKLQVAGRALSVVPVSIAVGRPVGTITLREVDPTEAG